LVEAEEIVAGGAVVGVVVLQALVHVFMREAEVHQYLHALRFYMKV
jgi:hypothetical protein